MGEATTIIRPYPGGNDLYLKADSFAEVYAGDLSPQQAKVLAAAQRPIDPTALGESFLGSPTWRNVPMWVVVSTQDSSIPTEAQRSMAARTRATMNLLKTRLHRHVSEMTLFGHMTVSTIGKHKPAFSLPIISR